MAKMRVLIADDSELVLAELREELGKEFDIVRAVANGEEAVCAFFALIQMYSCRTSPCRSRTAFKPRCVFANATRAPKFCFYPARITRVLLCRPQFTGDVRPPGRWSNFADEKGRIKCMLKIPRKQV